MRRSGPALLLLVTMLLLVAAPASAEVSFSVTALEPTGHVEDVAVGDLDGKDGPDLVTAYTEGGVTVQLNDGHGHFGAPRTFATGCDTNQVEIADVGAPPSSIFPDGHPDVVISCVYGSGETVYLGRMFGDGAGNLSEPVMFPESSYGPFGGGVVGPADHQAFALVEFRGSSGPPVPAWGYLTQEVTISGSHFNRLLCFSYDWSTRTCTNAGEAPEPGIPFVPGRVADAELFTTGGTEGLLDWGPNPYWHASTRDFGPQPTVVTGGDAWNSIAIGDLQGDGPDIFTSAGTSGAVPNEPATGRVSVLYGNSAEGVLPQHATTFPSVLGVEAINTGDFDLDGRGDVVGTYWNYSAAAGGVGGVFFQSGDGAGHLGAPQELPLYNGETFNVVPVRVADLDGNGTPDVVAIVGGKVQVLLNQKLLPPPGTGGGAKGPVVQPISKALEALAGVKGLGSKATALPTGYVVLGTASNPPTKSVLITLTLPAGKPKGSSLVTARAKGGKKQPKPTVIGKATITVPAGKTVPLKVKLSAAARAKLKKGPLHATVTLVATSTSGAQQTKTAALTIKPAKKKHAKK
jgi:FG-GAP-like repeat